MTERDLNNRIISGVASQEGERRQEKLPMSQRLIEAGFELQEMGWEKHQLNSWSPIGESPDFSDQALKFVRETSGSKTMQDAFIRFVYHNMSEPGDLIDTINNINSLAEKAVKDKTLKSEYRKFSKWLSHNYGGSYDYQSKISLASLVIGNSRLFEMYDKDVGNLIGQIENAKDEEDYNATPFSIGLNNIVKSENFDLLTAGLDYHALEFLREENSETAVSSPENARFLNEFYKTERRWPDKLRYLFKVFEKEGIPLYVDNEKLEKVLSTIAFIEHPRNPVNSLGLSTTIGYEIEYPSDTEAVERINRTEIIKLLDLIGIKEGDGGGGEDETSPGPFNRPETANFLYQIYCKAGLINTKETLGMNLHFNVGKLEEIDEVESELVTLIRGLYMTGAAYDPHAGLPENDEIFIIYNDTHWEAKAFDITTDSDHMWNFKSASYLTWAMKASFDKGKGLPGGSYRRDLSRLWTEYKERLSVGLEYLGIPEYLVEIGSLNNDGTQTREAELVHNQLKSLWSDPNWYEIPDINVKGQQSREVENEDGILGVEVDGIWYPNIAVYSRQVTNEIVTKITDIKYKIEADCLKDVKRISRLKAGDRYMEIRKFVKKYNVLVEGKRTKKAMLDAFGEVRELMLLQESLK